MDKELPRVAVVGLLPAQQARVRERVAHLARLEFVRTDVARPRLSTSVEDVVVLTRFLSHRSYRLAQHRAVRLHHANGGVASVIHAIHRIAGVSGARGA